MVGAVIGSYQIVQKLGSGGMGAVYLGQHTLLGRRAAIKVLLPSLSARADVVRRFFNEARAVTSISDPGIVQVFDFGYHSDGSAFIVMEFLEGETLEQRLARIGRLSVLGALQLGQQLASSLAQAHAQRIIHRDLKPENIFLVRDGGGASGERSKILDFGIAKLSNDHPGKGETHTGVLMGTPRYMSPEQCRGLSEIDHRADVYALGCVMFHMLTGRPPFDGEGVGDIISAHIREAAPAPSSLVAEIPSIVDALVLRCLAKAPPDRWSSMTEVAASIGRLLPQLPADAMLQYAPGAERATPPASPAPRSPLLSTKVAPPPAPTTLGESSGQLARAASRSTTVGRWIAVFLVLAAVGAGIAIISTPNQAATQVAATYPDAAMEASGKDRPTVAAAENAPDAGSVAPVTPDARAPTDDPEEVTIIDEEPADAAEAAPPVASAPGATPESAKEPAPPPPPRERTPSPPPSPVPVQPKPAPSPPLRERTAPPPTSPVQPKPSPSPPPRERPAPPPTSSAQPKPAPLRTLPTPSPKKCSKAEFAAVYNAVAPSPDAVRAALGNLKSCRDSGAINNDEFNRYQAALINKH